MAKVTVNAFTFTYAPVANVLKTHVHIAAPFSNPSNVDITSCGAREFNGIWDTGATCSVITPKVVNECGLKPIGITQVYALGGPRLCNVHLIGIFLPNQVSFSPVRVTEGDLTGDCDVLIGMDIISQGDFVITNQNGGTTFTFRTPSVASIDFVKEIKEWKEKEAAATRPSVPKVGRNAPCPCNSGKKYMQCCGR